MLRYLKCLSWLVVSSLEIIVEGKKYTSGFLKFITCGTWSYCCTVYL